MLCVVFLSALLLFLHWHCPLNKILGLCVFPLLHPAIPPPTLDLKSEFSQHVGMIQLCNMIPATAAAVPSLPILPGGVLGGH
jgi:hypothetical protein